MGNRHSGPFPLTVRQMKYLVVAIEYFTKWIEAEPVAQITAHKIQHFVWKNVVCRFGVWEVSSFRQWHTVCEPTTGQVVHGGRNKTSVRIG